MKKLSRVPRFRASLHRPPQQSVPRKMCQKRSRARSQVQVQRLIQVQTMKEVSRQKITLHIILAVTYSNLHQLRYSNCLRSALWAAVLREWANSISNLELSNSNNNNFISCPGRLLLIVVNSQWEETTMSRMWRNLSNSTKRRLHKSSTLSNSHYFFSNNSNSLSN